MQNNKVPFVAKVKAVEQAGLIKPGGYKQIIEELKRQQR